jgi:hypothetical protein
MSIFMGTPLDSTMTPNGIMSAQPKTPPAPQPQQAPAPKGRPSAPGLQKLPGQNMTSSQARDVRSQRQK